MRHDMLKQQVTELHVFSVLRYQHHLYVLCSTVPRLQQGTPPH